MWITINNRIDTCCKTYSTESSTSLSTVKEALVPTGSREVRPPLTKEREIETSRVTSTQIRGRAVGSCTDLINDEIDYNYHYRGPTSFGKDEPIFSNTG